MADSINPDSHNKNQPVTADQDASAKSAELLSQQHAKCIAQHQHWMRVMMEGQATPDPRYQRPKR